MPENKEIALVTRLSRGDERAFEELYMGYRGVAYFFVLSFVKDSSVAKDIVHDSFIKIWLKRENLALVVSFDSYLFRMLRNAVMDYFETLQINRRYIAETLKCTDDFSEITSNQVSLDELELIIFDAVSNMPERRREVFRLSRYQNIENSEIALRLGIDIRTVENHITAAMAAIRARIAEVYA